MKFYNKHLFFLLLLSISFFCKTTLASGGPDAYGYIWKDSNDSAGPVYNWIDIRNFQEVIEVKLLADDNFRGPYQMGFTFPYYWYGFNEFSIGSNGNITLNHQQYAHPYRYFPNTVFPQNIIAPFGSDLSFEHDSTAKCYLYISADHDSVVVSWEEVPYFDTIAPDFSTPFRNTFQLILSMLDSSITFQYKEVHVYNAIGSYFFSAGIESNGGNIGLSYLANVFPTNQTAVKFYRPNNSSTQITDLAVHWSGSPGTKGITLNNNSYINQFESAIINQGNTNIDTVLVTGKLFDPGGNVLFTSNQTSTQILPGQSQNITFPIPYQFTQVGRYSFRTSFFYQSDSLTHNNQAKQEIIVVDTTLGPVTLGWCDYWFDGGFNWVSYSGGLGVFITPPFYPFKITSLMYYISSRASNSSFKAQVFAESFVPNQPGISLFSTTVQANTFNSNDWCEIPINPPIHLNSGSIYVGWEGNGSQVTFGVDNTEPYSNHAYEYFGFMWAPFRYVNVEPMIAVKAIPAAPYNAIEDRKIKEEFSVFPNPSNGIFYIKAEMLPAMGKNVFVEVYNNQGQKIIAPNKATNEGLLEVNLASVDNGIYHVFVHYQNGIMQGKLIKNE